MTAHQLLTNQQRYRKQLRLSQRHRSWCSNLPAVDIDSDGHQLLESVFLEYDAAEPVAVIDYKSASWDMDASTWALVRFAERAHLPGRFVQYQDNGDDAWTWMFRVSIVALNAEGLPRAFEPQVLTEKQYVRWLHGIRGRFPGRIGCCSVMREAIA